jgi:hypothetical protein
MSNAEFKWILHCNEDNHDKVWGVFSYGAPLVTGGVVYIFWGKRGKQMSFKKTTLDYALTKTMRSKLDKGYREITEATLLKGWPDFHDVLDMRLVFCTLSNQVK